MAILGTMKVLDIQEKEGYSLVTFEIPDDCKQFLIEYAIRELLTKAAEETKAKYGSVLPESQQTVDNNVNKVYNEDEADDEGWFPNTGRKPVGDSVRVDTEWEDGSVDHCILAGDCDWGNLNMMYWRLSKQDK